MEKEKILLLQQDDCAPDSFEYFIDEMEEKFGVKYQDIKEKGVSTVSDDAMGISWEYQGYILEFWADDPYYHLYKIKEK